MTVVVGDRHKDGDPLKEWQELRHKEHRDSFPLLIQLPIGRKLSVVDFHGVDQGEGIFRVEETVEGEPCGLEKYLPVVVGTFSVDEVLLHLLHLPRMTTTVIDLLWNTEEVAVVVLGVERVLA
jgi:hypothetical protein